MPTISPAAPPSPGPIRKTREMTRSTLMPMSRAAPGSMATARMAAPVRVRWMKAESPSISSTLAAMTSRRTPGTAMPKTCTVKSGRRKSG